MQGCCAPEAGETALLRHLVEWWNGLLRSHRNPAVPASTHRL